MKRFDDMPIYAFSSIVNIMVACPHYGKAGIVTVNLEHNLVHFRCASCYFQ